MINHLVKKNLLFCCQKYKEKTPDLLLNFKKSKKNNQFCKNINHKITLKDNWKMYNLSNYLIQNTIKKEIGNLVMTCLTKFIILYQHQNFMVAKQESKIK